MKKRLITGLLMLCLVLGTAMPSTQALGLGDILKVGGIGLLLDKFSTPLNNFINTLMAKHGAGTDYATKVVPILTVGSKGYIGAAQVTGPTDLVDQTEADSKNPTNFSRVQGVGVSAIIDIHI